jgi:hypothetical protein
LNREIATTDVSAFEIASDITVSMLAITSAGEGAG